MNRRTPAVFCLLLALSALAAAATAAEPDWYFQHPDAFPRLPTNKLFYLEQKHGLCPSQRQRDLPESLNVRMVGKWGGGPSWAVTGKDTLVYLSRGSEVVVLSFADTANPRILNYIQAKRLAGRPVLSGNLLYLVTSGYIEVFNVADPTNVPRVGRLSVPVADIDVQDSLVYIIGADSFMVYNFADPANPVRLGVCRDSGYALDVDRGYAYLRDRWGMYILDARNPASPRRVASWGTDIAGVKVRGNHCYVAQGQMGSGSLHVLNVANPAAPWQEGRLSGLTGEDIYLVDTLLFTCEFDIVSVADSSRPRLIGHLAMPQDRHGVWAEERLRRAYVAANYAGLQVVDLRSLSQPVMDTWLLPMSEAYDVSAGIATACVAAPSTGLTVLDISDPTSVRELANLDTAGVGPVSEGVVNAESLAYIGWWTYPGDCFRVVDISDPSRPAAVTIVSGFRTPSAMVLRDSFLYCAEDYKFEVFSVADPRQPVWRGSCDAYSSALGIDVRDSLAFVAPHLQIFNVADPANPVRIYETTGNRVNGRGIAARDTFVYFLSNYDTLWVYGIADPTSPHVVGATPSGSHRGFDLVLRDSYAYAGCQDFRLFDVTSPAAPVPAAYYATPYYSMDIDLSGRYIFIASYLAGVTVLELLPVGLAEPRGQPVLNETDGLRVAPNPVRGRALVEWGRRYGLASLTLRDVTGREIDRWAADSRGSTNSVKVDLSRLRAGVYFVSVNVQGRSVSSKLVKQ